MKIRRVHYISGLTLAFFVGLHLFNHFCSIFGAEKHIEVMNSLRYLYRNVIVETILLLAVLVQIVSGLKLFTINRRTATSGFEKLLVWTGFYLAVFLVIHLSAVFVGRVFLELDTNFYFGVAGLNSFPFNLFFIPYYALAILSFFGHVAAIHSRAMKVDLIGMTPHQQARAIVIFGAVMTVIIFYGLTNGYSGVTIPEEYQILVRGPFN